MPSILFAAYRKHNGQVEELSGWLNDSVLRTRTLKPEDACFPPAVPPADHWNLTSYQNTWADIQRVIFFRNNELTFIVDCDPGPSWLEIIKKYPQNFTLRMRIDPALGLRLDQQQLGIIFKVDGSLKKELVLLPDRPDPKDPDLGMTAICGDSSTMDRNYVLAKTEQTRADLIGRLGLEAEDTMPFGKQDPTGVIYFTIDKCPDGVRRRLKFMRPLKLHVEQLTGGDLPKLVVPQIGKKSLEWDASGRPPAIEVATKEKGVLKLWLVQQEDIFDNVKNYKLDAPKAPWQVWLDGAHSLWNESVALPYLRAIESTKASQSLSFVPTWYGDMDYPYRAVFDVFWTNGESPYTRGNALGQAALPGWTLKLNNYARSPVEEDEKSGQLSLPNCIDHQNNPVTLALQSFDSPPVNGTTCKSMMAIERTQDDKVQDLQNGKARYRVRWQITKGDDKDSRAQTVRMGALDLQFRDRFTKDVGEQAFAMEFSFPDWGQGLGCTQPFIRTIDFATTPPHEASPQTDPVKLPICGISIGAQDPTPETDWLDAERDNTYARVPPLIVPLPEPESPKPILTLKISEDNPTDSVQKVELELLCNEEQPVRLGAALILDPWPYSVIGISEVDLMPDATSNSVATWVNGGPEALTWRIRTDPGTYVIKFPPSGIGETMAKPDPVANGVNSSTLKDNTADFRFSPPAIATVRPSDHTRNYNEPPWNIRRLLGNVGQQIAGVPLTRLDFELLFGLSIKVEAPQLRISEQQSRWGVMPGPLPDHPLWWHAKRDGNDRVDALMKKHEAFVNAWQSEYVKRHHRLANYEIWSPAQPDQLALDQGVDFRQRDADKAELKSPVKTVPPQIGLESGWSWGFESENIYKAVIRNPRSTSGHLRRPALSALGGSGWQKGGFDEDRSFIIGDTSIGRTFFYSLERIGRICVFWNRAKHVIVYERTVLPSDQFKNTECKGRAIIRKVEEYVEILEPCRDLAVPGSVSIDTGFVLGLNFPTNGKENPKIPVTSAWGRDVGTEGWMIPLWRADSNNNIYPKPDVQAKVAGTPTEGTTAGAPPAFAEIANPQVLRFFTSTEEGTGNDTNKWRSYEDVDYCDRLLHSIKDGNTHDPGAPDEILASPPLVPTGFADFTLIFPENAPTTNVVHGRSQSVIGARPRSAVVMRGIATARATSDVSLLDPETFAVVYNKIGAPKKDSSYFPNNAADGSTPYTPIHALEDLSKVRNQVSNLKEQVESALKQNSQKINDSIGSALTTAKKQLSNVSQFISHCDNWRMTHLEKGGSPCEAIKAYAGTAIGTATDALVREIDQHRDNLLDAVDKYSAAPERALAVLDEAIRCIGLSRPFDPGFSAAQDTIARIAKDSSEWIENRCTDLDSITALVSGRLDAAANLPQDADSIRAWWLLEKSALDAAMNQLPAAVIVLADNLATAVGRLSELGLPGIKVNGTAASKAIHDSAQKVSDGFNSAWSDALDGIDQAIQPADAKVEDIKQALQDAKTEITKNTGIAKDDLHKIQTNVIDPACRTLTTKISNVTTSAIAPIDAIRNDLVNVFEALRTSIAAVTPQDSAKVKDTIRTASSELERKLREDGQKKAVDAINSNITDLCNLLGDGWTTRITNLITLWEDSFAGLPALRDFLNSADRELSEFGEAMGRAYRSGVKKLEEQFPNLDALNKLRFQLPTMDAKLPRAIIEAPKALLQDLNRLNVGLDFLPGIPRIDMTPALALVDRLGGELKPFGLRVPHDGLLDRLLSQPLPKFDVSLLFPKLAGMSNVFGGATPPPFSGLDDDRIKIRHGVDRESKRAWVDVDAEVPFGSGDTLTVFNQQPVAVSVRGAKLSAHAHIDAGLDGKMQRKAQGSMLGNWVLTVGGAEVVTFHDTLMRFDESGQFQFDISPERIEVAQAFKFITEMMKAWMDKQNAKLAKSGISLELIEDHGKPTGVQMLLGLPVPPIEAGVFGISGMNLTASLGLGMLQMPKEFGNIPREFAIRAGFSLGSVTKPFTITVFILGGAGWIDVTTTYLPSSGKVYTALDISLGASARIGFNFGVVAGGVQLYLGVRARLFSANSGSHVTIGLILSANGSAVLCGIVSVGVGLILEARYQDGGGLVGLGTFYASVSLGPWYELKVEEHAQYNF